MEEIVISRDEIIKVVIAQEWITKLLQWIQMEWRKQRSLQEDEKDQLLHGCRAIDSIIEKIQSLEWDVDKYDNVVKEIEIQRDEEEWEKVDPYAVYEKLIK